jgi:hypothetical protein
MAPTITCRLLLTAIAACGLALPLHTAHAQLLEFTGAELRGRIDRPSQENVWTFGDANGNGALDDEERFGARISIDKAFIESPGTATAGPGPTPLRRQVDRTDFQLNGVFANFGPITPLDLDDIQSESISSNTYATFNSAQLMQVLHFEGAPEFTFTRAHEDLELGYGIRFLAAPQEAQFARRGLLVAETVNSSLENQALGPQLSARWSVRHGRWHACAEAAVALTYMNIDGDQSVHLGTMLIPGQLNRPAIMAPNQASNQLSEWDIAPTIEAGLLASYDLTPSSLVFIRGDAIQFGNIRGVEQAVVWQLPTMGLRDPGGQDVTITAASIGLEVRR